MSSATSFISSQYIMPHFVVLFAPFFVFLYYPRYDRGEDVVNKGGQGQGQGGGMHHMQHGGQHFNFHFRH
jgi:hypothetical protein